MKTTHRNTVPAAVTAALILLLLTTAGCGRVKPAVSNVNAAATASESTAAAPKAAAAVAVAQPPASVVWTQVTPPPGSMLMNPALLRTSDGVLHVVATTGRETGLADTTISPEGRVSDKPVQILSGWDGITNPAMIETPDGRLMVLFGGTHTVETNDPWLFRGLLGATSSDHGSTWTYTPGDLSPSRTVYACDVQAAVVAQGQPYTAWTAPMGRIAWQSGFSATGTQAEYEGEKCCASKPSLGVDSSTGEVVLAWDSYGTRYAIVGPGAPTVQQLVPDSTLLLNGELKMNQVDLQPVSGRLGAPGVYIAYPGFCGGIKDCVSLNLWRVGSTAPPMILDKQLGPAQKVSLARAPEGRLWVSWHRDKQFLAVRSNKAVTAFGRPIPVTDAMGWLWPELATHSNGDLGPLDLLPNILSKDHRNVWHTRIFPELTVTASPELIPAVGGSVTITVTDVGDPVAGSRISIGGMTLTTDAQGHATYAAPKRATPAPISIKVTAPGYAEANLKL